MFETASPSETAAPMDGVDAGPLAGVRVRGGLDLAFERVGAKTRLVTRRERDGYKVRTPSGSQTTEAVMINTGGGIAGGDRVAIDVAAGAGTCAVVTTAQAERIYGTRQTAPADVDISLTVSPEARLAWLPQETILFDQSRFRRSLTVDLDETASILMAECTVLGRSARGERFQTGLFRDRWRVRRVGRLVFAETLAIADPVGATLARPGAAPGAAAFATALYIGTDADARAQRLRRAITQPSSAAVTTYGELAVVRILSDTALEVRSLLIAALAHLHDEPLPRVWST